MTGQFDVLQSIAHCTWNGSSDASYLYPVHEGGKANIGTMAGNIRTVSPVEFSNFYSGIAYSRGRETFVYSVRSMYYLPVGETAAKALD